KQDLPCMPVDPTTGSPFPGNKIPSSSFSRLAQVTAGLFFPAPNANPAINSGNNLRVTGAFPLTSNQQTYRLDQSLGRWGTIFGRGTYATYKNTSFNGTVSQPEGYLFFEETAKSWMVSHTISVGFDYRRWHLMRNLDNDFFGEYTFTNDLVSRNSANCPNATGLCGTGNAIADYLLGYYQRASGFFPAPLSSTTVAGNPQDH